MGLDREVEEVSRVERKIHKRTDVSSTRLRQKNKNGSWHVRLCNGRVLSMDYKNK